MPHTAIDLHPMKEETFNLDTGINTDNKGFRRPVEKFTEIGSGAKQALYMGRQADHKDFHYLESWLIPELYLRVNRFHFREGFKPTQDLYIDIAAIDLPGRKPETNSKADEHDGSYSWHTTDLYIDVVTHHTPRLDVLDLDEFGAALDAGMIPHQYVAPALIATQRLLDGITATGSAEQWLAGCGYPLTWKDT